MAQSDHLDVNLAVLPQRFTVNLNGEDFDFRFRYSPPADAYYVDCWDSDGVKIVMGEKLEYGEVLFATINDPRLPVAVMIPQDESGQESTIDFGNFQKSTFIFLPEDLSDDDDAVDLANQLFGDDSDDDDDQDDENDTGDPINLYGEDETVDDLS